MARWLTRPNHPLTARVLVNRIWQQQFGQGIVKTADNFGRLGTLPSHPELLDWLAVESVEHGWSIKHVHCLIVTSTAFRQRSAITAEHELHDLDNALLSRMQVEATRTLDLSRETPQTLAMYGIGADETDSFGRRCLLARRLIERGVRFVQLFPKGQAWDNHKAIRTSLPDICRKTDKPIAGLLRDLRQRGLLDSTLVIWGGEFGRLPTAQVAANGDNKNAGRDHGPYGFSSWMAGGGVKAGVVHGNTDEIGYAAAESRVSIQDWHATILYLLGLQHDKLFFERNRLREKLTHQFGARVVREIIA